MKEIIYNNSNLKANEIDEIVIRVKALIINSKNELLLGYSHNCYQFPGGHMEDGESLKETLIREIEEETGIKIEDKDYKPFMYISHMNRNYRETGKNRNNKIYYFVVETDEKPNMDNTNYTDDEIDGNYELRYIKLDKVIDELIDNASIYPESRVISEEMVHTIKEYDSVYKCK